MTNVRNFLTQSVFLVLGHEWFKFIIRNRLGAVICAELLIHRLNKISVARSQDGLKVLVFSAFRYKQDLRCLSETGKFTFWTIDPELVTKMNSVFKNRSLKEDDNYFAEKNQTILNLRRNYQKFLVSVLKRIQKRIGLDAIVTPAIHYRSEYDWCRAAVLAKLPAVAIHKEFTLIGKEHVKRRVHDYQLKSAKFMGSRVLTTNETGKRLFQDAGIHDRSRIEMVGLPRADQVLGPRSEYRQPSSRKIATLFSFGHYSGEMEKIPDERRSHYFSWGSDEGFVELVLGTHSAFAQAAIERPDCEFVIKPKYVTSAWCEVIEELVKEGTGRDMVDIPNLRISDEEAPSLMRDSAVVIGFNSTVVIESRILDKPTLIPMFGEASGELNRYVYFNEFLSLFETPKSRDELQARILHLVDGGITSQGDDAETKEMFVRKHFGYVDGQTGERVYEQLQNAIADAEDLYEEVISRSYTFDPKERGINL